MRMLLVIGCGNPIAGDDSAGVEIVERLRVTGRHAARFLTVAQPGVELLDEFGEADAVLFIDAVCSGAAPGTIHLLNADAANLESRPLVAASAHGWSLGELLKLARSLGRQLPPVFVLGIEAATVTPGCARTAGVQRAVEAVVDRFPALKAHLAGDEFRNPGVLETLFSNDGPHSAGIARHSSGGGNAHV